MSLTNKSIKPPEFHKISHFESEKLKKHSGKGYGTLPILLRRWGWGRPLPTPLSLSTENFWLRHCFTESADMTSSCRRISTFHRGDGDADSTERPERRYYYCCCCCCCRCRCNEFMTASLICPFTSAGGAGRRRLSDRQ